MWCSSLEEEQTDREFSFVKSIIRPVSLSLSLSVCVCVCAFVCVCRLIWVQEEV